MIQTYSNCLGFVAPYYNLVLVTIVILLFIRLFRTHNPKVYITPWKFLFAALLIYVLEEFATILEGIHLIHLPAFMFPFFETVMITLFIYMLLIQKAHVERT